MIDSNKITNTKIGDDIHFYVNGTEDRGIVVKMNNEYVTIFKESTQEYDDIHINDTFFIKDILINKEWDKMDDDERYDALKKIHAPSPRFIMKSWYELPKEIKELLQKNNAIETSYKDGKDDDMNRVGTRDNQSNTPNDSAEKAFSKGVRAKPEDSVAGKDTKEKPIKGETKRIDSGKMPEGKPYEKNPETITNHNLPEEFRTIDEKEGESKGTKNTTGIKFMTEGGGGLGVFDKNPLGSGLKNDKARHKEKAWQLWLAKREQQVLKEDINKILPAIAAGAGKIAEGAGKVGSSIAAGVGNAASSVGEAAGSAVGEAAGSVASKIDPPDEGVEKSFYEQWLDNKKTNSERSIHGNAGREPNSGVNTNIGFDASEDYEGFSHSGVRPEQFKHERKKPKVTTKERINIGSTAPSQGGQGTGDGGNPHNTRQQNKDVKGRAVSGKDRK